MPLPKKKQILRCRIKRKIAIEHGCINAIGGGSYHTYRIPTLPTQGTGPDVFVDVSAEEPVAFSRHALDLPFTDKGIKACRLKGSTPALGQSAV